MQTLPWKHPTAGPPKVYTHEERDAALRSSLLKNPTDVTGAQPRIRSEDQGYSETTEEVRLKLRGRLKNATTTEAFVAVLQEMKLLTPVQEFLLIYYLHLITPVTEPSHPAFASFDAFESMVEQLGLDSVTQAYLLLQYQYLIGKSPRFIQPLRNEVRSPQEYELLSVLPSVESAAHTLVSSPNIGPQAEMEPPHPEEKIHTLLMRLKRIFDSK